MAAWSTLDSVLEGPNTENAISYADCRVFAVTARELSLGLPVSLVVKNS